MRKTLDDFYAAYAAWLNDGAPEGKPFTRSAGLCYNLETFSIPYWRDLYRLANQLIDQFREAGLCTVTPFNGNVPYLEEKETNTCHLNEARRKWVFDHAPKG